MSIIQRSTWQRILGAALVVAAIAQPLAQSVRHDVLLTREDTRTLAKEWIEATIPEGSKIAVDWQVHGPPLSTSERAVPYSNRVYDVHVIGGKGLSDHLLDWYKEQGFDYLISSSFISGSWLLPQCKCPAQRAFYASLDDELVLVQEFRSYQGDVEPSFVLDEIYGPVIALWRRVRPGPTLKIYKVQ